MPQNEQNAKSKAKMTGKAAKAVKALKVVTTPRAATTVQLPNDLEGNVAQTATLELPQLNAIPTAHDLTSSIIPVENVSACNQTIVKQTGNSFTNQT